MCNLRQVNFNGTNNIEKIGSFAFGYCTLTSFNIGAKTDYIADGAFLNSGITSFSINNTNYTWKNNVLINNNVTDTSNKIAIYANQISTAISIPDEVETLGAYLFTGNKNIKLDYLGLEHVWSIKLFTY